MRNIKTELLATVDNFVLAKIGEKNAEALPIEVTRREFEGDLTIVVFPLVRTLRASPEKLANELGEFMMQHHTEIASFNVIKGFLNIKLSAEYWADWLRQCTEDEAWLRPASGEDLILVEFSSPNTNKPLHLGHLRNIFLGHSVSLTREFAGMQVVKTQIINDRGVHICKSMLAWVKFGNGETPESSGMKGDKLVGKYYVKYDTELRKQVAELVAGGMDEKTAQHEAPLAKEVREMLVKWETGDPEVLELWQMMNGWVYDGFDETYERLGVEFDKLYYESDTYKLGKQIVLDACQSGIEGFYKKEDGSVWINLESEGLDHKLLIRADGTTVYITQDIGTAVQRYRDFPGLKQVIYTVGDEQDYHFRVLFAILHRLGYEWARACVHLSYGMVDLPSGKMKSREGTVVDADDLLDEVIHAAREVSIEKGRLDELNEAEREKLFEVLGKGALKFFLLRVDPKKRMLFDPGESVSLTGDTGPFIQYTYARCRAVLRKAEMGHAFNRPNDLSDKERHLLTHLSRFREIVFTAADELNPAHLAGYVLDLAHAYNKFYQDIPILKADESSRGFRIALTKLTADTIREGLGLLAIDVPERM
ncbi:MAG: arginine--tRNA ligase [Salibacteraceae bacterium]